MWHRMPGNGRRRHRRQQRRVDTVTIRRGLKESAEGVMEMHRAAIRGMIGVIGVVALALLAPLATAAQANTIVSLEFDDAWSNATRGVMHSAPRSRPSMHRSGTATPQ